MDKNAACHDSAKSHVAGESLYLEDFAPTRGEVYVGIAVSPVAHGRLQSIDASSALGIPGVIGVFTAKDFIHNRWGPNVEDQPILAEGELNYIGEPIALVAAVSNAVAKAGAAAVQFRIEILPHVLTIDAARSQGAFLQPASSLARGDIELGMLEADHVLEGSFFNLGQDHFYLESQSAIAYPGEGGDILVHSSTQHPTEVQHIVAESLGLSLSQVICVVKRMGGGFGGKESQASHYAALCALVAHKLRRVARLHLTKDDDMSWTGKRHAFANDYRVGFKKDGTITAADLMLYSDGGAYLDLSMPVLQRAMLHCDNAYFIPHIRIAGQICKTNQAPNTAFRGFGGPQGVVMIEHIMEEIAFHLELDPFVVRKRNLYGKSTRNITHYGQLIDHNPLPEILDQICETVDYVKRREEIEQFNQSQKHFIRSLSIVPVKFGISFTLKHLNQGNALVNIHRDGTVQVSTGATEMGQGVNIKIAQIVAEVFGIETSAIRMMITSTEKNHNTSPTAASSGSDINGFAAQIAAQKIRKRLAGFASYYLNLDLEERKKAHLNRDDFEPVLSDEEIQREILFQDGKVYYREDPDGSILFSELVNMAYFHRVAMGDYGFYKTKGIYFDRARGCGNPFLYFSNGAAASEVQIDTYTGEVKVLRTDILMDLGRPINQGIDQGQIAGAFVQGLGWVTTEELRISSEGRVLTHSPTTYKIPNIQDIPRIFNIAFFDNPHNDRNVRGSKAVGEPPLLLAFSVWTAVKEALQKKRREKVNLKLPATQEEVLRNLLGRKDYYDPNGRIL